MSLSRVTARFSRTVLTQCRNSVPLFRWRDSNKYHSFSNLLIYSRGSIDKVISGQVSLLNPSDLNSAVFQWYGFSSSTSPQPNGKETANTGNNEENNKEDNEAGEVTKKTEESLSDGKTESDSDLESELSRDDLVKLVAEKEQDLLTMQEELKQMKDKVLRAFAEMENVKEHTRRESENAKKSAFLNFAKSLLDVEDNLRRAYSAAKRSFSKIDASKDPAGAVQQLKTLLEGVEMTQKQLYKVFLYLLVFLSEQRGSW